VEASVADLASISIAFFSAWWGPVMAIVATIGGAFGAFEGAKHLTRFIFRSKSRLVKENEDLHRLLKEKREEIAGLQTDNGKLNAELKAARDCLPDAAIARAEKEWRDKNYERASRELQNWFDANAASIARIAISLARFHISRAVPDPGDHLDIARNMLRLARAAMPGNQEARDLESELDRVNAGLQEQLLLDGDSQIAWNSGMAPRFGDQREQFLPAIRAIDGVARYCFKKGLYRLASIFGDRASDIALSGGPALRNIWFAVERQAVSYQRANGHYSEAFDRIETLIAESQKSLGEHHPDVLRCRYYRVDVLGKLGLSDKGLIELDQLVPIFTKVFGERHSDVLICRTLRAKILERLRRYEEALKEINQFAPIQAEILGERHPNVLASRHLRAEVLTYLGHNEEALSEIDRFAPIKAEILGERHPEVLATRYLRATILGRLGRYDEAQTEVNQFGPAQTEVLGERHPDVLAGRHLRARILHDLGRYDEALSETGQYATIQAEVLGNNQSSVLLTECLKADLLEHLRRDDEARAELDALEPRLSDRTDADGRRRRWVQEIRARLDGRLPPAAAAAE
jgi:tetratricopeptide (TPR) repeat protein